MNAGEVVSYLANNLTNYIRQLMLYARYGNVSHPFKEISWTISLRCRVRAAFKFSAASLLRHRLYAPLWPRFMELCNPLRRFMEIIKQFPWSAIKIVEQNPFVFSAFTVRLSELAFLENNENRIVSFIGINIFKKQFLYNNNYIKFYTRRL